MKYQLLTDKHVRRQDQLPLVPVHPPEAVLLEIATPVGA